MAHRRWLISGVSSGFGREFTEQLLERGQRVVAASTDFPPADAAPVRGEALGGEKP